MDYLPGDADLILNYGMTVIRWPNDSSGRSITSGNTVVGTGGKSKLENMVKMLPDVDALA
jgi:hypothetical protein